MKIPGRKKNDIHPELVAIFVYPMWRVIDAQSDRTVAKGSKAEEALIA